MEDLTLSFDCKDSAVEYFKSKYGKGLNKALVYDDHYGGGKQSRYICKGIYFTYCMYAIYMCL